jgi:16S rRNA (cytosine967-C5)-methyltransferase
MSPIQSQKIPMHNPRQLAFQALIDIQRRGTFTDIALDRVLRNTPLSSADRGLVTELVYGSVRRQRTLDSLIDQLGKKKAHQQPPELRTILHIGLYQLRYQKHIPARAAVNTTVELAKENGFKGLAGVVNGLLRQYERLATASTISNSLIEPEQQNPQSNDPLQLPTEPVERLGVLHSFPDWIIQMWQEQLGFDEAEQLCAWLNQTPTIDLRVNPLRISIEEVEAAMQSAGVEVRRIPQLPQALRVTGGTGNIQQLPGFSQGWWTVQDSSAQLVSHLLNPQSR